MLLTALEPRRLMHGWGGGAHDVHDHTGTGDFRHADLTPYVFDLSATQATLDAQVAAAGVDKIAVAGGVPVLSSRPGATAKLYLDFNGDAASTWGSYNVPTTPAYDQDGDVTTFNSAEVASIREVWARVSEKYSPLNIDVTTVEPATLTNKVALKVVIGGAGAWLGSLAGGVAYIGSFANSAPNVAYVFSANLSNGFAKYTGEAVAHESGHAFGLQHQSRYNSSGQRTDEYNPGTSATAPIMGTSYSAARGLWWNGTATSSTALQDDLKVIAGVSNAFGYRVDDHGNVLGAATPLTLSGSTFAGSGVIETITDADYFTFTTGPAALTLSLSVADLGAMLDGTLKVFASAGTIVASADTTALGETLTLNLSAGTYGIGVFSHGSYGDVGQYTLAGSLTAALQEPEIVVVDAPSGLLANTVSATAIDLTWVDQADNETGFLVQRSSDGGTTWGTVTTTGADAVAFRDSAVAAGTTYHYRVRAYNDQAESAFTGTAWATTLPTAPATVSAVAMSATEINIMWAAVSGATGYVLERSPADGSGGWSVVAAADATSFADAGLAPGARYRYRVRAANAAGSSEYSQVVDAVTVPAAPVGVVATAVSPTKLLVSWQLVVGATEYVIERSGGGSAGWTTLATTDASVTTLLDAALLTETPYSYRIRAANTSGTSAYSSAVGTTTLPAPITVTDPASLLAAPVSATQVQLSWEDHSGNEDGFIIERSTDGGTTWNVLTVTNPNATSYSDVSVGGGATYTYRVMAYSGSVGSDYTPAVTVTTVPVAPSTPTATSPSSGRIKLSWAAVSGATGYVLERSPADGSGGWSVVAATDATSFADVGLAPGARYHYRVRAANAAGSSEYSPVASAKTAPAAPNAPTDLTVTPYTTLGLQLAWQDHSINEAGFRIEYSTDGRNWRLAGLVPAGSTDCVIVGVQRRPTYTFRVAAYNEMGLSGNSDVASGRVAVLTSSSRGVVQDALADEVVLNLRRVSRAWPNLSADLAPAAPSNLSAVSLTARSVGLSWEDSSDNELGFRIEYSLNGRTWRLAGLVAADQTGCQINNLQGRRVYMFRVTAYNLAGLSGATLPVQGRPATTSSAGQFSMQAGLEGTATTGAVLDLQRVGKVWPGLPFGMRFA